MYLALESMTKISSVVSSIITESSVVVDAVVVVVDVVRASLVAPRVGTSFIDDDCKISVSDRLVDSRDVKLDVLSSRDLSSLISCSAISAISLDVGSVLMTAFFGPDNGAA